MAPCRDARARRARMSDAAKDLVKSVGVSGVNIVRDGKELRSHNPHNTLVVFTA